MGSEKGVMRKGIYQVWGQSAAQGGELEVGSLQDSAELCGGHRRMEGMTCAWMGWCPS